MSTYDWVLAVHVTGAFLFLGGAVVAGVFNVFALRSERPSEIALFLGLTRVAVYTISAGALLSLVFGLWLVHEAGFGYGDAWIVVALVLWLVGSFMGDRGGRIDRQTRELATRLATEGDAPSPELRARLRDPKSIVLSWGSGVVILAVLVLMIWKPGA